MARPEVNTNARAYLTSCLSNKTELNAVGAYAWFHSSAMLKAARYAKENLNAEEKSALILAALADEAFALHFLEDIYAAGHVAGIWVVLQKEKEHMINYNEKGLEVVTWDGKRMELSEMLHA